MPYFLNYRISKMETFNYWAFKNKIVFNLEYIGIYLKLGKMY